MIPQLRRTLQTIGTLHNLNDQHMENLAAMLFITHYRHSIPDFDERIMYEEELAGINPLKKALKAYRDAKDVYMTKCFHESNIVV